MGFIDIVKGLVFPEGLPYKIQSVDKIRQPGGHYIDHLLDLDCNIKPEMHLLLNTELTEQKSEDYAMHWVAEFSKKSEVNYSLWNAERSKQMFDSSANYLNLTKPGLTYWCLGHDALSFLKKNQWDFQNHVDIDLNHQKSLLKKGKTPKREIDLDGFNECLLIYQQLGGNLDLLRNQI